MRRLLSVMLAVACLVTMGTGITAYARLDEGAEPGTENSSGSTGEGTGTSSESAAAGTEASSESAAAGAEASSGNTVADTGDAPVSPQTQPDIQSAVFPFGNTAETSTNPAAETSSESTSEPTAEPSNEPTSEPTAEPSSEPTAEPTDNTEDPSDTIKPPKPTIALIDHVGTKITLRIEGRAEGYVVYGGSPRETLPIVSSSERRQGTDFVAAVAVAPTRMDYPYVVSVGLFDLVDGEKVYGPEATLTIEGSTTPPDPTNDPAESGEGDNSDANKSGETNNAGGEGDVNTTPNDGENQPPVDEEGKDDGGDSANLDEGDGEDEVEEIVIIEEELADEETPTTSGINLFSADVGSLTGAMPVVTPIEGTAGATYVSEVDTSDAPEDSRAPGKPELSVLSSSEIEDGNVLKFEVKVSGEADGYYIYGQSLSDGTPKIVEKGPFASGSTEATVIGYKEGKPFYRYQIAARLFNDIGDDRVYGPWAYATIEDPAIAAAEKEAAEAAEKEAADIAASEANVLDIQSVEPLSLASGALIELLTNTTSGTTIHVEGKAKSMLLTYVKDGKRVSYKRYGPSTVTNSTAEQTFSENITISQSILPATFELFYSTTEYATATKYSGVVTRSVEKPASQQPLSAPANAKIYPDTFDVSWDKVKDAVKYRVTVYTLSRDTSNANPSDSDSEIHGPFDVTTEFIDLDDHLTDIQKNYRAIWVNVEAIDANNRAGAISKTNTVWIPSSTTVDTAPVKPVINLIHHYADGKIRVEVIVNAQGIEIVDSDGKRVEPDKDLTVQGDHYAVTHDLTPTKYPYTLTVRAYNNTSKGARIESVSTLTMSSNTHPIGPTLAYDADAKAVYLKSPSGISSVDYSGWVVTAGGNTVSFDKKNQAPGAGVKLADLNAAARAGVLQTGDTIYVYAQSWTLTNGTYVQSQRSSPLVIAYKADENAETELSMSGTVYEETPTKMTIRVEITGPIDPDSMLDVRRDSATGEVIGSIPGSQLMSKTWVEFTDYALKAGNKYVATYTKADGTTVEADLTVPDSLKVYGNVVYPGISYSDGYISWFFDFGFGPNDYVSYMVYELISTSGTVNKVTSTTGTRISVPSSSAVLSNAYIAYTVRTVWRPDGGNIKLVSAPYPAYVFKGVDLPDYSDQNTNTSWDDSDPANAGDSNDDSLWWDGFYYRDKNGYYYDQYGNFISYSDPSGLSYTSGDGTVYYTTGEADSGTVNYQSGVTVTESGNNTTTFSATPYSYTPSVSAETYTASVEGAMRLPQSFVFEPYGADPSITNNSVMQPLLSKAFEGLVATDPATGEQIGANAKDFTISDDGLTYTFDLRSELKWSDGTPLTAQDYVYTYERILDPETDAKNAALLTLYIDGAEEYKNGEADKSQLGIDAVDENTLVIKIKEESDHFLTLLTAWTFSPVQQAAVETGGSAWTQNANSFVSNGPYKVQSITPSQIILVPNQNYTGPNPATQDQVVFDLTN
jgi:hypothetical protein